MATSNTRDSDGPGPTSAHNILTIPMEMFEAVAEAMEPEDLLSLRLVNREAEAKVKRTFTEAHFTERMFLVSDEQSLETLLAIAEHPGFGRSMRKVLLCNEELPGPEHPILVRDNHMRIPRPERHPLDAQIVSVVQDCRWLRLCKERKHFLDRDGDIHMLARIFSTFRRMRNVPALAMMDQGEARMRARGARTLELLSGRELIWGEDDDRPVDAPLSALTLAGLPVADLTISFDNFGWTFFQLLEDPTAKECAESAFRTLRSLHISSRCYDDLTLDDIEDAAALLGSCTMLENLTFKILAGFRSMSVQGAPSRFSNAFLHQTLPKLKKMSLRQFSWPFEDLIAFFKRHDKLVSAAFDCTNFFPLGAYDDGLNNTRGQRDKCMIQLLQSATELSDIYVTQSLVPEWFECEPETDSDERTDSSDGDASDGDSDGADEE